MSKFCVPQTVVLRALRRAGVVRLSGNIVRYTGQIRLKSDLPQTT